jgi:glycosidase
LYRDYLELGKMDYLYDKVEFYDSLKAVMQGQGNMQAIADIQQSMQDIDVNMLHFLENHDEQRIASPDFAGDAEKGKPALVVSALISRSPTMIYFGQEVGEDGSEETGFGDPTRTTIFDYAGVPAHQRWMNEGKFDGALLSEGEKALRQYHIDVLNISAYHPAMRGNYDNIHAFNVGLSSAYSEQQFAFVRRSDEKVLIVVSNFSEQAISTELHIPMDLIFDWQLSEGKYVLTDLISDAENYLSVDRKRSASTIELELAPLESFVYELNLAERSSSAQLSKQVNEEAL